MTAHIEKPDPVAPGMAKGKMRPRAGSPPGIETDGHGNVIPLAERTPEDQAAALAAGERDDTSLKNPEGEAGNPAPMPKSQQGQGGAPKPRDPEGQQG